MNNKQMNEFLKDKKIDDGIKFITIDIFGSVHGHIDEPSTFAGLWCWKHRQYLGRVESPKNWKKELYTYE